MSEPWPDLEPFQPARGLGNRHVQSMLAYLLRRSAPNDLQRERVELPDGDFVDLDFAASDLEDDAPLILLLHGLEGSAASPYALQLYHLLQAHGMRAVGLNFRSCSGELNRTTRLYHAGATEDVHFVQQLLARRFTRARHGIVGVSLGANVLLKFLSELDGDSRAVSAAVAISPFFDMRDCSATFDEGSGRPYARYFLQSLKQKLHAKADQLEGCIDVTGALAATTVREFDDLVTAPLHGFAGADDYYRRCSSHNFLADIETPTLLIRALDDPFFTAGDIPYATIAQNRYLFPAFTEHGGHVGFVERYWGGFWAERQTARFMAHWLQHPS